MHAQASVVIPCYRCADTIVRAVDSVLRQTLPASEIILVDDCSDDAGATLGALKALQEAHRAVDIHIVALEKNCGPGGARNAGWGVAHGQYLAFLDADDTWHPRKLEIQLAWMQSNPDVVLTAGTSTVLQAGEIPPTLQPSPKVWRVSGRKLLLTNCFPTRTVVLRRDIELRFDPIKRYAEDYLLWLRIVLGGMPAYVIDLPLAFSYKAEYGAAGLTANLWKMEKGEIDAFLKIRADGHIHRLGSYFLILYSLAKFARRLALSALAGGKIS